VRKPIYAANWKMYKTNKEVMEFFEDFVGLLKNKNNGEILIAPSFTTLATSVHAGGDFATIAAQNFHHEPNGAYTGEVNASMVKETGTEAVLIGHSERRHIFGEGDNLINKKVLSALENELQAVLCIGELIEDREADNTKTVLGKQISIGLKNVSAEAMANIVIAYEPVWAIGTGKTATPEIAQDAHEFIRSLVKSLYGEKTADAVRILYGGSVKPANIAVLMSQPDIDGVLVGGASLKADSFAAIVDHE
jgi:triosephosphate isomerase